MKFTFANMPKIALALLLMPFLMAFSACNKSNTQSTSANSADANKADAKPVIEFRRTACYGTCPIYQATISRSGKVTFVGERFTDKIGTFTGKISEAEVSNLLREIDEVKFFERDSLYVTGATDFPSIILRVRNHGKYHTIRTEGEGPNEIEELMKRVDRAILNSLPVKKEKTLE